MVQSFNIDLTKHQVEQLEYFADFLESVNDSTEEANTKFLMFILNIESLLPFSNSFNYILKNDLYKNELDHIDREMWKLKNRLSDIHNDIDSSEWSVDSNSNEEMVFNKIREELLMKKRLNYGNI